MTATVSCKPAIEELPLITNLDLSRSVGDLAEAAGLDIHAAPTSEVILPERFPIRSDHARDTSLCLVSFGMTMPFREVEDWLDDRTVMMRPADLKELLAFANRGLKLRNSGERALPECPVVAIGSLKQADEGWLVPYLYHQNGQLVLSRWNCTETDFLSKCQFLAVPLFPDPK